MLLPLILNTHPNNNPFLPHSNNTTLSQKIYNETKFSLSHPNQNQNKSNQMKQINEEEDKKIPQWRIWVGQDVTMRLCSFPEVVAVKEGGVAAVCKRREAESRWFTREGGWSVRFYRHWWCSRLVGRPELFSVWRFSGVACGLERVACDVPNLDSKETSKLVMRTIISIPPFWGGSCYCIRKNKLWVEVCLFIRKFVLWWFMLEMVLMKSSFYCIQKKCLCMFNYGLCYVWFIVDIMWRLWWMWRRYGMVVDVSINVMMLICFLGFSKLLMVKV